MKKVFQKLVIITTAVVVFASCNKDNGYNGSVNPGPTVNKVVFSAAGDSAGILTKLNEFRVLAGDPVNSAPGAAAGRREVNWDGVPANFTNNNTYPFDFFGSSDPLLGNARKRGLITTSTAFRLDSTDFSELEPSNANQFEPFSKKKLFAPIGSNVTDVTFKVPGTETPAFVKGFAVIFSDVDLADLTTVEYFNGNKSLGVFKALPASQGYSLVGVGFPDEKVTRVKITTGNGLLAAGVKDITNGGTKDLVAMDDFIYSEPQALQ